MEFFFSQPKLFNVFLVFRPQREARLEILPQVQNFSEIDFPILEDLVLTNEEPLPLEEENVSLPDAPTESPEMWLKKFYDKKIFPRKLNSEQTEPFNLETAATESSQKVTVGGSSENLFGDLSFQNATTTLNIDITTLDSQITATPSTTTPTIKDAIKDYEYIVFFNDKVKFKNFEFEEDYDYDTASLPDSDFNTINMLNDFFKITKKVGVSESQRLRFEDEPSTIKSAEDENELDATIFTETPTTIEIPDPNLEERTTLKTSNKLSASIVEEPTTTFSTDTIEEKSENENEILTTTPLGLNVSVTPIPEFTTGKNFVDTEASIFEVKKLNSKKSKIERLTKLKRKKGFRNQIEHFYKSKNPKFDFKIRDLAPFEDDFNFNFGNRSPVEDIRKKMSELLGKSNDETPQRLEPLQQSRQINSQQRQEKVSFDGFENFGSNFQAFPSTAPQRPSVFSQFDDFSTTEILFPPKVSQRRRRITFQVPESVKKDLIYHWINNN